LYENRVRRTFFVQFQDLCTARKTFCRIPSTKIVHNRHQQQIRRHLFEVHMQKCNYTPRLSNTTAHTMGIVLRRCSYIKKRLK